MGQIGRGEDMSPTSSDQPAPKERRPCVVCGGDMPFTNRSVPASWGYPGPTCSWKHYVTMKLEDEEQERRDA